MVGNGVGLGSVGWCKQPTHMDRDVSTFLFGAYIVLTFFEVHHPVRGIFQSKSLKKVVRPAGFEPTAPRLGIWCSILLSYGRPALPFRARVAIWQSADFS